MRIPSKRIAENNLVHAHLRLKHDFSTRIFGTSSYSDLMNRLIHNQKIVEKGKLAWTTF